MGYTHYFGPTKFTPNQFESLIKASKEVVKIATGKMKIPLAFECDETGKEPLLADNLIRFNGVGGDGHETFMLEAQGEWNFCKTARKPYDTPVVAILCLAHHYNDGIDVSSDGEPEDWEEGLALAKRVVPECKLPPKIIR